MATLESKMASSTMKEWQKYSQDQDKMPPYTKILKFLNLQARDTENNIVCDDVRKR